MKQCTKCNEVKPLEEFSKRSSAKDGLRYHCKSCNKASNNKWNKNNREKRKAINDKWKKDNPEKAKASSKKWYKNNQEKVKAINNKWKKDNPDKVKEWYKKNPDYSKKRHESKKEGHFSIYVLEGTQGVYGKGYVGQTTNLYFRMSDHKSNGKIFDRYTILDTAQTLKEALYLEAQYHVVGYGGASPNESKLRAQIIKENKLKLINK